MARRSMALLQAQAGRHGAIHTWHAMAKTQTHVHARFPAPAASWLSSYASSRANSTLSPSVTIRNALASQGRLQLHLPLPGLPGLSPIQINEDTATVQQLIDAVKKADGELKAVDVTTTNGTKIARTMHLKELTGMDFILRLNHVNVSVQNDAVDDEKRQSGEGVAFASIKASIEKDSRPFMSLEEYYKICSTAGAEEGVANKWLRELQRRNLVVHFDRSSNAELKNTILLRPNSTESKLLLENALDSELYTVQITRKSRETKLQELESALKKLKVIGEETHKDARKLPNAGKWVALSGITTFYGSLMYMVWDVYSWDVMEPITYFIGFTAVLANSFYHTITKKDATYTNIWQKNYRKRLANLHEERRYTPAKVSALEDKIADVQRDVELLTRLEGKRSVVPEIKPLTL
ncbi:hypothetical protein Poli38472_010788 [Pythium oligandrum]|uniref:Calcium uniporter protein C-terminal domain-containing protein n=1 Tax=Pythium oligandrum TaxID=41045 RepID=A0A8K1FFJ4_PYTOL|nr:hypothetical protein Poli38472_010788 [Pythium oligandrum]|eukprot:TMW61725.1 hypothetical protein Poli38472_010788 [Pythium oligandrum]